MLAGGAHTVDVEKMRPPRGEGAPEKKGKLENQPSFSSARRQ